MVRSMYSGVAGLRNHQVKMDVIGNNISNVNTYGFKAGRATFAEMFNQTLSPASGPAASGALGGVNPKQVGLGSSTVALDVIHTEGGTQATDRTLDIAIVDEGFFTVTDGENTYYTRAGNMYLDPYGYLVTAGGEYVLGLMLISDSDLPENMTESVVDIITSDEKVIWGNGKDDNTQMFDMVDSGEVPMYVEGADGAESRDEIFGRIVIPSTYHSIAINERGVVTAIDENGVAVSVACLITTTFVNPSGLTRVGSNLYAESPNSGLPAIGFPGEGNNGTLQPGALEMSNVDLSKEFTDMIVTQRGFQANSRIITVSDTLLEELINLKR